MKTIITFLIGVLVGGIAVFLASNESFTFSSLGSSAITDTTTKCAGQNLRIDTVSDGDTVTFPLTIGVTVDNRSTRCAWTVFEWQAGIVNLVDASNTILATGVLTTAQNWMQVWPINFMTTLQPTTTITSPSTLSLVFIAENPSGEPSREQTKTISVTY